MQATAATPWSHVEQGPSTLWGPIEKELSASSQAKQSKEMVKEVVAVDPYYIYSGHESFEILSCSLAFPPTLWILPPQVRS